MITEKKYSFLISLTRNLYVISFVMETVLYYLKTDNILRLLSLIPLLINLFLFIILFNFLKKGTLDISERNNKIKKGILNLFLNLLFIIFIVSRILIL
jgi:hypothetical protein